MPIEDVIDLNIDLAAAVIPEPAFGISCLLTTLNSRQYSKFKVLSGGGETLKIGAAGRRDTLEELTIVDGERAFEQVDRHFTGFRTASELILSYRGRPTQKHNQKIVVGEDEPGTGLAAVGLYSITTSGGPYQYQSPGVVQVIDVEVEDAGGGNATTGLYTVQDGEGNNVQYTSGAKQFWVVTVSTLTIPLLYAVTVEGTVYSYTSVAGDDEADVRNGILADMSSPTAHPPHPNWIGVVSGIDGLKVETQAFGVVVVLTAVQAELTPVETVEAVETIAAVVAALQAAVAAVAPSTYSVADAAPSLVFTANLPGKNLGILVGGRSVGLGVPVGGAVTQTVTADYRETVTAVRDALGVLLTAGTHPEFTNANNGGNAIDLLGIVVGVFVDLVAEGPKSGSMLVLETQSILEMAVAQISLITVLPDLATGPASAYLGPYTATLFGITASYTATAGDSVSTVRDALEGSISLALAGVTTAIAAAGSFTITNNTAGQAFAVALTSPNSNQAMTHTITTAVYGIGPDIVRAFDDSSDWYFLLNGQDDDLSISEGVKTVEGLIPGRSHVAQSPDNEIRDVPFASATDVAKVLADLALERGTIIYHPLESGEKPYKAPFSQWVSDYAVKLPGAINPSRRRLRGFQFAKYTTQQASNLNSKRAGFLDQWRSIDVQAFLGGKSHSGRAFDLIRGLDQTTALVQLAITDLMLNADILPYTPDGQNRVANAILKVFAVLVSQGFGIENSLILTVPKLATATPQQQQDGVMPPFGMSFRAQVGTNKVIVNGTISQVTSNAVALAA